MTIHMVEHDHGCFAQLIVNPQSVELLGLELVLHTLYVPPQYRGLGHGRELLNRSIEFAGDRTVALAPVPDSDCPIDVVAWYGRHRFTFTNSGGMMERRKDDQTSMGLDRV